jgi:NAD dependent epimerase/dehydratase
MKLSGAKILVTGADGFIGSHLVEHLVETGHDVRALVQYNSFNSWGWLDGAPPEVRDAIEVVASDVRDPHGVADAVQGCAVVLHLAALIAIPYSYHAPDAYVATNVTGTLNVLQACRRQGVERLVTTSTSEVYGSAEYVPMDEAHPLKGQSPYSATKIGADKMSLAFHRSFDVPVAVLRPFNTYGPRQSARAVIPTIIGQVASGARTIKLGALSPTRDFTFVRDTARSFAAIAACDDAIGEVVNIGSGFEISVEDTAAAIARVMGAEIEIVCEAERLRPEASEVDRLFADTTKARRLFGWEPRYGGPEGFERGLEETARWFEDPANLAAYKIDRYNI